MRLTAFCNIQDFSFLYAEQGLFNETTSLQVFPTTGKPDIRNLSNALKEVCNWYQLGIQLGVPTSELRKVEDEYQRSDRRKSETLDTWLQQTPSASWSDVVSALQQMGENTVAESVRQKYIGGVTSKLIHIYINFPTAVKLKPLPANGACMHHGFMMSYLVMSLGDRFCVIKQKGLDTRRWEGAPKECKQHGHV